ncbi:hypothetical protein SAMN04487926_14533 [Paraburkholderia steynii]|uniref:Uncharacterized protein n=1 Tax=Paraburkholderia steynii TaxID=1245441 RepID=A0A7Z7BJ50_9BURK|nr:hypothetical protein [Paraburkholderia steynii]SDJ36506.1 hypothetical protein SAMN04487926_14533 [Paraburkholderia steynii]
MAKFKPDERQQKLIETARRSHREAQARGRFAPRRLVEKWSSEAGIMSPRETGSSERAGDDDSGPEGHEK